MSLPFRLYNVFAETPFAGTQIAVVISPTSLAEALKVKLVSEFSHSDTVFLDRSNTAAPFTVYNSRGKTSFGAHTTLAAAQAALDLGLSREQGSYYEYQLLDDNFSVSTFIDKAPTADRKVMYSRMFDFTTDRFVPELSNIAAALSTDVKHLSYARYRPRLVSVDTPVLVVPMTRPEHIIEARLDNRLWTSLLSDIYANFILLVARGTVSGRADFYGRLLHPDFKAQEFPPIGSVIPEFIAYLCSDEQTSVGTHSVTIDRGSPDSRQSLIHTEFDFRGGNQARCRIGGSVILMAEGQFVYD